MIEQSVCRPIEQPFRISTADAVNIRRGLLHHAFHLFHGQKERYMAFRVGGADDAALEQAVLQYWPDEEFTEANHYGTLSLRRGAAPVLAITLCDGQKFAYHRAQIVDIARKQLAIPYPPPPAAPVEDGLFASL